MAKEPLSYQPIEIFGKSWKPEKQGGITLLIPESSNHPDIDLYRTLIPATNERLRAIDRVQATQIIAFCEPDFYWERFLKKAERSGFDPQAWTWSEGDIDTTEVGKVFCLKLGADFSSESERQRFVAHELDHPRVNVHSPVIGGLLTDSEGIVEADARIALGIQANTDMVGSTRFITEIPSSKLVPAHQINTVGYDHPSFYGKRPSESEGYASAFLWFLGLSIEAAKRIGVDGSVRDRFLAGRAEITRIAHGCSSVDEYKEGLSNMGINYDQLSQDADILIKSQEALQGI